MQRPHGLRMCSGRLQRQHQQHQAMCAPRVWSKTLKCRSVGADAVLFRCSREVDTQRRTVSRICACLIHSCDEDAPQLQMLLSQMAHHHVLPSVFLVISLLTSTINAACDPSKIMAWKWSSQSGAYAIMVAQSAADCPCNTDPFPLFGGSSRPVDPIPSATWPSNLARTCNSLGSTITDAIRNPEGCSVRCSYGMLGTSPMHHTTTKYTTAIHLVITAWHVVYHMHRFPAGGGPHFWWYAWLCGGSIVGHGHNLMMFPPYTDPHTVGFDGSKFGTWGFPQHAHTFPMHTLTHRVSRVPPWHIQSD